MRLVVSILALFCGAVIFSACAEDESIQVSASEVLLVYPQSEFTVTSTSDWRLESEGDEFAVSPTQGSAGTTKICVEYTHNEKKTENKAAMLTITDGENSKSVKVIQETAKIVLTPESLEFPAEGGVKEIKMELNCHWDFTFTMSETEGFWHKWIEVISFDIENNTLAVTLSENNSAEPRSNEIIYIVYGGWFRKLLEISQKGKE